ncbi:hypothetical protein HZI73_00440 [Vallitalea pronyensis]|uniref:Uncharacterized protein n=1 Tax=Vallitalea pronyensis TaxID=1348613 RepID=A0A8J8MGG0_9FIRM|nr:hypothetical protein [Vallitalea pronyensis]QUI20868.1 hypothetical protein HZI73_00440 [Vallitalea pronyensis]
MKCKDSDVFALESSIEKILNTGEWKDIKEIETELKKSEEQKYINWIQRKNEHYKEEHAEDLFYQELMDRMCKLFPMKYKHDTKSSVYGRIMSLSDDNY